MNPNEPLDLGSILAEMNRRIKNLESRNAMQNTKITAYVENNTPYPGIETVAKFGDLGDGTIGVEIGSQLSTSALRVDNVNGMITPEIPIPIQNGNPEAFNDNLDNMVWVSYAQRCSHAGVEYRCRVTTGVGDVVEVWLENALGTTTTHVVIPASTSILVSWAWLHGVPIGYENQFKFHAQRTSGATDYLVFEPNKFAYVGPDGCTVTGL